jgi:hypothetical protein
MYTKKQGCNKEGKNDRKPWTGPESSRRLRLPNFKKIGTRSLSALRTGGLYPPPPFPQEIFLVSAKCGQKNYVKEKLQ